MRTVRDLNDEIGISEPIRKADNLHAGDSFEVERLILGQDVVTQAPPSRPHFSVATGRNGLPVIRSENGIITLQRVKELESLTP